MRAEDFIAAKDLGQGNIFFVYGEEAYLRDAACKRIEAMDGFEPRDMNVTKLSEQATAADILNAAMLLPCFSERRLVRVDGSSLFSSDAANFVGKLEEIPETTVLLFVFPGAPDKRRALAKHLIKNAVAIEAEKPKREWLKRRITDALTAAEKNITSAAADLLMELAGEDMYTLIGEIDKLKNIREDRITEKEVLAHASHSTEYDVFRVHTLLMNGKYEKAIKLVHTVYENEKSYIPMTGLLANKFRLMYVAKGCLAGGMSASAAAEEVSKREKAAPYPAKLAVNESKSFSIKNLKNALQRLSDFDYSLKSGAPDAGIEVLLAEIYQDTLK